MTFKNIRVVSVLFVLSIAAGGILADGNTTLHNFVQLLIAPTPASTAKGTYSGYKGITIGNTADTVRQKLGAPKDKADEQDLYVLSDNESAQFFYDAGHVVTAIMITYTGDLKTAPKPMDVFGEEAPPKADGGIFKMIRYPKAGYWISYNRSGGEEAVISVAIQKMFRGPN